MRAAIVVDLGFGDAGKGLVTDYLARTLGATLVVRFNGGAQAGHNVVTPDGRHHTFAQFGAASFLPGVRTHLAAPVVVHPTALAVEAAHLERAGVPDPLARVSADERALVITPFHQSANRLRELARGPHRHGSCGVGIGEAVADAIADPTEALRMGDLRDRPRTRRALLRLQDRKRADLAPLIAATRTSPTAALEIALLEDPSVIDRWLDALAPVLAKIAIVDDTFLAAALAQSPAVIFEGAQGVLLDEWIGFHPHTTYSTCTFANALALLHAHAYQGPISRIGVLRTYVVRHGEGPLPTHDPTLNLPEPHNPPGPWQGQVRQGWPDALLARYAADSCNGLDALALTHLDALARIPSWRICNAYRLQHDAPDLFRLTSNDSRLATAIRPPKHHDLDRQAALATALAHASPLYEPAARTDPEQAIAFYEEATGAPVRLTAWGPSATNIHPRGTPI